MDPVLATDVGSDQTTTCVASRQCVEGAGAGAGASKNGKGMIVVGGDRKGKGSTWQPAGQQ